MNATRLLVTMFVCLGLGLPAAHGIAVCVTADGNVAVEAAVDGACVGSRVGGCCDEDGEGGRSSLSSNGSSHRGGCRDVVLNAGGMDPPPPSDRDSHRLLKTACDALASSADLLGTNDISFELDGSASQPPVHPPPPGGTAVLLL